MDHRRTPAGKSLTLPGWAIIASALACIAAAAFYGVLLIGGSTNTTASEKPTITPSATVAPTTAPTSEAPSTAPTATPTATPTVPKPSPTAATGRPADDAARDIPIGVYNNTSTAGLARTVAAKAEAVGWQISRTANWRGQVPANTVYYPAGFATQAQLLGKDLGFTRVLPATATMQSDQLTLVLSGQQ